MKSIIDILDQRRWPSICKSTLIQKLTPWRFLRQFTRWKYEVEAMSIKWVRISCWQKIHLHHEEINPHNIPGVKRIASWPLSILLTTWKLNLKLDPSYGYHYLTAKHPIHFWVSFDPKAQSTYRKTNTIPTGVKDGVKGLSISTMFATIRNVVRLSKAWLHNDRSSSHDWQN